MSHGACINGDCIDPWHCAVTGGCVVEDLDLEDEDEEVEEE